MANTNTIPDAAVLLAAAHRRTAERSAAKKKSPGVNSWLIRIGAMVVGLFVLLAGANALMMALLH